MTQSTSNNKKQTAEDKKIAKVAKIAKAAKVAKAARRRVNNDRLALKAIRKKVKEEKHKQTLEKKEEREEEKKEVSIEITDMLISLQQEKSANCLFLENIITNQEIDIEDRLRASNIYAKHYDFTTVGVLLEDRKYNFIKQTMKSKQGSLKSIVPFSITTKEIGDVDVIDATIQD